MSKDVYIYEMTQNPNRHVYMETITIMNPPSFSITPDTIQSILSFSIPSIVDQDEEMPTITRESFTKSYFSLKKYQKKSFVEKLGTL